MQLLGRDFARCAVLLALTVGLSCGPLASAGSAAAPLAIYVNGNHFVNGDGDIVRLTGTGGTSTEYQCSGGYQYGNYDPQQEATAMASWHSNATRVPLNQDCWLGTHGLPSRFPAGKTAAGYQQYIEQLVADANADGLYVILDLHFTGPNSEGSTGQRQMPDADSITFWRSVAARFAGDHAVIFDAFNEPVSSTDPNGPSTHGRPIGWGCWASGGCAVADYDLTFGTAYGADYTAVGLQQLVDAIRSTGATQPIILGGLNYANDLSQWLAYEPRDAVTPSQLAASFHDYDQNACHGAACLTGLGAVTSVAAQVPVVTGEFGYINGDNGICAPGAQNSTDFANEFMNWGDQNGISYLGFGWSTPTLNNGAVEDTCANAATYGQPFEAHLVSDATGTPAAPLGTEVHAHLATVSNITSPGPGVPSITAVTTTTTSTTTTQRTTTTTTTTTTTSHAGSATISNVSVAAAARGGVKLTVRVSGAGTVGSVATYSVRRHRRTRTHRYASATATIRSGGQLRMTLRPSRAVLRALHAGSRVRLQVVISFTPHASHRALHRTLVVTVRVPRR